MPPQKPTTEEEEFELVDEGEDDEFEFVEEAPKPTVAKPGIWKSVSEAPESLRRFMRSVGESIVPTEQKTPADVMRSIAGGMIGGVGPIGTEEEVPGVAGLMSPLNIGLTAIGGGEAVALRQAAKLKDLGKINQARKAMTAAGALERVRQVGSAPVAYHGATTLLSPESTMSERLFAVPELAGGLAGLSARVPATRRAMEAAPTRLAPEATDIPLRKVGEQFRAEPDIVGDIPLDRGVPYRQTPDEILREAGGPPLDPRISGLAPETELTSVPELGPEAMAGPKVGPGLSVTPDSFTEKALKIFGPGAEQIDLGAERTKIEAAREAAKEEVNQQLGLTPEEVAAMKERGGKKPATTKPTTVIVKKDIPQTVNELLSQGYQFLGTTPDGHPRMGLQVPEAPVEEVVPRPVMGEVLPEEEGPQFARTAEGLLKIGSNIKRQAGELTTGYNTALPGIMMREAMQNAIDAVKAQGKSGSINVKAYEDGFEIVDSGKGMSLEELETVFTNLHESGKVTQAGAAGGKGVGKASYMLGGQHFYGETITMENGKPVKYIIQGAPEELMEGFKEERIEMPEGTPTGTLVRTLFKPEQTKQSYASSSMLHNIMRYSMGQEAGVKSKSFGTFAGGEKDSYLLEQSWGEPGNEVGTTDLGHSEVGVFLKPGTKVGSRTNIGLKVLNNGMYQYDTYMYLEEETPDMPTELVINVKPQVEEFDEQGRPNDQYPFPVQRESVKDNVKKDIEAFIKDTLISPKLKFRKSKLKEIYDNLTPIPVLNATRKTVLFDPGDRLTPAEKKSLVNSQQIIQITDAIDTFLNDITLLSLNDAVIKRLEGVGIVLDPNMHGVHIPNPSSPKDNPKSIILINPFGAIESNKSPLSASIDLGVTIMHEAAHIGTETPSTLPPMRDEDLADPRVGTFLQTYIKETQQQGGIDLGHGFAFIKRLGDLYVRVGAKTWLRGTDRLRRVLTNKSGGYHSEITRLLSIYKESRGRDPVTEDYLSGTGIKHAAARGGTGNVPGGTSGSGSGTPLPKEIVVRQLDKNSAKALISLGYEASGESSPQGNPIWKLREEGKLGWQDWLHAPKGMMSVDLPFFTSAGFRQGLPMIGANFAGWAKSWWNSVRAYGAPHTYQMIMHDISKHPYFRRRPQPDGTMKESLATEVGLAMTDLGAFNKREEVINSKLAEKIKGYGLHVAGSNRAYTAFLNTLRANSFVRFANQAKSDSRSLTGFKITGRDIEQDTALGKEIADAINTLTGRGKLKLNIWGEKASINLEQAAKFLTSLFFSPRLQAARVKMLNPAAYINMDPFVRKMYLKGLFGAIGTWWSIASLMEMLGADVSKDPNNADFGKGRVGNTRVDPGGGFQQLLVLFSRLRPEWFRAPTEVPFPPYGELVEDPGGGKFTSSTSGETEYFGEGYPPRSRGSVAAQFTESKLDPTVKFAWDLFNADKQRPFSLMDKTLQLALPMMSGDIAEIIKEDPTLLPLVVIPSTVGMGASTYEGGKPQPSIVPPEWDIAIGEP